MVAQTRCRAEKKMKNQKQLSESYANKYEHYAHSVGVIMLHLQWCTKYRYKMFRKEENANLLDACIRRSASRNEKNKRVECPA